MEAPSVEAVHGKVKDSVGIYGVAWSGDDSSYGGFVDRHGLTFPNLDDTAGEVFRRYGVPSQPAWVFVDRAGTVTVSTGALGEADLERALRALAAS